MAQGDGAKDDRWKLETPPLSFDYEIYLAGMAINRMRAK